MKIYSDCYKYVVATLWQDIRRHDIAELLLKVALKQQKIIWEDILIATSM